MIIILKRISKETRKRDINNFIAPVVKGKIFQKSGHIENITIHSRVDSWIKEVTFFSLVYIDSDEAANRVIKKLNRKLLKGKHIEIKEYQYRSWENDPRTKPIKGNQLVSKRKVERRLSNLKSKRKKLKIEFFSDESFHRKF